MLQLMCKLCVAVGLPVKFVTLLSNGWAVSQSDKFDNWMWSGQTARHFWP